MEEQQEGNDAETQRREIELLRREGELPLEELLRSLPPQLLGGSCSPSRAPSSRDGDTREGPEAGGEEEPTQVLKVRAGGVWDVRTGTEGERSRQLCSEEVVSGVVPG